MQPEELVKSAKADASRLDEIARIFATAEERCPGHAYSELTLQERTSIRQLADRTAAAAATPTEQQKFDDMLERFRRQGAEFTALSEAAAAMDAMPPIVDDDYPEARFKFEGAFERLMNAMAENGRFKVGSNGALALLRVGLIVTEKK